MKVKFITAIVGLFEKPTNKLIALVLAMLFSAFVLTGCTGALNFEGCHYDDVKGVEVCFDGGTAWERVEDA